MSKQIFGIVPAGGQGTRLGLPFPKELLPIAGTTMYTPVIDYTMTAMYESGVDGIIVVCNDHKGQLLDYLAKRPYSHLITFAYQHTKPSASGGSSGFVEAISDAFTSALCHYGESVKRDASWLVGMPDTIMTNQNDVFCILRHQVQDGADVALSCYSTTHPERFGMVQINDVMLKKAWAYPVHDVINVVDKPKNYGPSGWMWGAFGVSTEFMEILKSSVHSRSGHGMDALFSAPIFGNTRLAVLNPNHRFFDMGTPAGINEYYEHIFCNA